MRDTSCALLTLAMTAACMMPYYPPPTQSASASPNISIVNNSSASTSGWPHDSTSASTNAPAQPPPVTREQSASNEPWPGGKDPRSVLILQGTHLDRSAEVLGPVDVHEQMANEAAALQRLRERAAALGADAVVGVEFHHGEEANEPTHLSGLAVRFITLPRDLR